jgi:hypothetical protein
MLCRRTRSPTPKTTGGNDVTQAAFENRDGSLSVVLDALPVDGKLQIRDHVAREQHPAQRAEQPAAGRQEPNDYDIPF